MPTFTITIADARFPLYKTSVLRNFPLPRGNNPDTGLPWTEDDFLKAIMEGRLIEIASSGHRRNIIDQAETDFENQRSQFDGIVEVT